MKIIDRGVYVFKHKNILFNEKNCMDGLILVILYYQNRLMYQVNIKSHFYGVPSLYAFLNLCPYFKCNAPLGLASLLLMYYNAASSLW